MLILGIETSTARVGCALGGAEGVLAGVYSSRGRHHAEHLHPAIEFACAQAGVRLTDVNLVAVDLGPGLFTGMRVGIATAKGVAYALGVPMIGIASLDLLAFPARFTSRLIVTAIDARRGELYSCAYRAAPGGVQRLGEYHLGAPEQLAAELEARREEVLLVGDGALRYREHFDVLEHVELADATVAHPSAASLVGLAYARAMREEFGSIESIEPIYLRQPDAEINWVSRPGGAR